MKVLDLFHGITGSNLPNYGVEAIIHRMDFPFFVNRVMYRDSGEENFELILPSLIFYYAEKLLKEKLGKPEKLEKKFEESLYAIFNLKEKINCGTLFNALYANTPQKLNFEVGHVEFQLRRFGKGVGLKLQSSNNRGEKHSDGERIFEVLCEEHKALITQFIHSAEFIIPLSKKVAENNSIVIDFCELHKKLTIACPYVTWIDSESFSTKICKDGYLSKLDKRAEVGRFRGGVLPITARLIHYKNEEHERKQIWRQGNFFGKIQNGRGQFSEGENLCLSIQVECPFEMNNFCKNIEPETSVSEIQGNLKLAVATIYAQLCAMVENTEPYAHAEI